MEEKEEKPGGAIRIDGTKVSAQIREELVTEVAALKAKTGKVPGLGVVLVGGRTDSRTYVNMKKKAAAEVGVHFVLQELPDTISQDDLLNIVRDLNADPSIHGIIVQMPLPAHISEKIILEAVSLEKDVDGFHPQNIGLLAMKGRNPLFVPCTPKVCIELLDRYKIPIDGKRAVILGRSNIVGIPVAMMLLHRNATITICHSRTPDISSICQQADIIIAAVGQPRMVKKDWIKPGATVIDVGINSVEDKTRKSGSRLVGDVDYAEVKTVAGAITPVPGGVGPMTVAMLISATVSSAKRFLMPPQQ